MKGIEKSSRALRLRRFSMVQLLIALALLLLLRAFCRRNQRRTSHCISPAFDSCWSPPSLRLVALYSTPKSSWFRYKLCDQHWQSRQMFWCERSNASHGDVRPRSNIRGRLRG